MMVRFGKDKKEFKEDEFRQDMSEFGDSLLVIFSTLSLINSPYC
jgi:dihydroxyacetone kinase-like predicted kinase